MSTLRAYTLFSAAVAPLLPGWLRRRQGKGKENARSVREKLGHYTPGAEDRGRVWIHAVSVGETRAALPLIRALHDLGHKVLLTGGTQTGAAVAAAHLPAGAVHVFAPCDTPRAVRAFLTAYRPRLGVFIDSELWPNLILQAAAAGPLLLLNARMSEPALQRRLRFRSLYAPLLRAFTALYAPDLATAQRFRALGAPRVAVTGSLKSASMPDDVPTARAAVADRRCWAAVSLHPPEFAPVCAAQQQLNDLLCILVPRHPEAGDAAEAAARAAGLRCRRRSRGEVPDDTTQIYLADTVGETGAWYRIASPAFIGGSLYPGGGGHNPHEALLLSARVLHGPYVREFAADYAALQSTPVQAADLAEAVRAAAALPRLPATPPNETALTAALAACIHLLRSDAAGYPA